jgi:adenine-specific DNA-methyltransferase
LLPAELFEEQGIHQLLLDDSPEANSYYLAVLQNLFFATLNTEMDRPGEAPNRRFINVGDGKQSSDHMIHTFWRHKHLLRNPEAFAQKLRQVPFLNGGLFECLDDRVQKGNSPFTEEIRIDGFSVDQKKQPRLPNSLFFGREQVIDLSDAYGDPRRKRETVRPLLSILESYNFTLAENTPLDREVALDPELLGHVFENLLAAYNPETGMVARKATGSFYTPRVVVDWMVDQALLVHLGKALAVANNQQAPEQPDSRLCQLLEWDETVPSLSPIETNSLIDAIDHLKVLDPACGSGAFPMGMLQKLVHVLRKLDPHNEGWRYRQKLALDAVESPAVREQAYHAIERAFARDNDDYGRKLFLIENCLYGVDIQPMACQIAKLRLFIALIVDQAIDPKELNYGILPLPNLETKVVAANTLLGLHRGQLRLVSERVRELEAQLLRVRHDYFTARRYGDKKALRLRDRELCAALATALDEGGEFTPYDTKRIAEWNPYDTNTAATFFDPAWMFGLTSPADGHEGVFDIVVGNPPYVRQEQVRKDSATGSDGQEHSLKDVLRDLYECYTGTADLYVYFFERSLQLLRCGGVLSFITSDKYMRAAYGERLRIYLAHATHLRSILDFSDSPMFTSIAYPCILVTEKTRHLDKGQLPIPSSLAQTDDGNRLFDAPDRLVRVHTWNPGSSLSEFPSIFEKQAHCLPQRDLKPGGWQLESSASLRLLEHFRQVGVSLGQHVDGKLFYGIKTGLNEAFVVDRSTRDRLIHEHPSAAEVLKPFLRGRDIKRWRCESQDLWLLFIPWHFPLPVERGHHAISEKAERELARRYPSIFAHLLGHKPELSARNRAETGIRYEWFALQRWGAEYWPQFEQMKIVVPAIEDEVSFAPDYQGFFGNDKTSIIIPPSVPFALAVLNSAVSWWITRQTFSSKQGGFFEFKPMYLSQLPIPAATPEQQRWCECLAQALIWLHRLDVNPMPEGVPASLMKAYLEQWLNGLVFELFIPEEFHARSLKLFSETAKLNPPRLSSTPEQHELGQLVESFERAYDLNAPLRSMLFSLHSLETVRIVEDMPILSNDSARKAE